MPPLPEGPWEATGMVELCLCGSRATETTKQTHLREHQLFSFPHLQMNINGFM